MAFTTPLTITQEGYSETLLEQSGQFPEATWNI